MVSSLVCAVLFATAPLQQFPRQNLLNRLVPHPTGKNGYEEYLRGAEIASDAYCSVYDNWMPDMDVPDDAKDADPRLALIRRLNTMSYFQVRKEEVVKFGGALDYVREGNLKAIADPREILKPESIFPELTYFRRISRMFNADAYVKFAEGHSAAGTKDYVDGLTFAYNISPCCLVSTLVGIAMMNILLNNLADRLPSLSIDDCRQLELVADRILRAQSSISLSMEGERKSQQYIIATFFTKDFNLADILGTNSKDGDALEEKARALTPAGRDRLRARLSVLVDAHFSAMQDRLRRPESAWLGAQEDLEARLSQESDPLVRTFFELLLPVFDQAYIAAARCRTQLRLLYLNARVMEFKWQNNRYPLRLAELGSSVNVRDPLSGQDFVYEPRGNGYRLYSKGIDQTGEIEMKYVGAPRLQLSPTP